MYTLRNKYWPAYTWKIQTSYSENFEDDVINKLKISKEDFKTIFFNIFNKINASFYHLQKLKESEEITIKLGKKLSSIEIPEMKKMIGIAFSYYEPAQYEYESFLISIKSSLDFISILISNSVGRNEDEITGISNAAKSRQIRRLPLENSLYNLALIQPYSQLINEFKNPNRGKSKRNFAVHVGSLPIGGINTPINNPKASVTLFKMLDPYNKNLGYINAPNLVKYCDSMFYTTCDFLIDVLSILSNTKLKHGFKMSLLEYKQLHEQQQK